ncbi:hypothetical protein K458DRAFT_301956, partial [Lentithecium fluviatile CBS 122367]
KKAKTYNSGDSPMVTHLTTNPPVEDLSCEERTGFRVFLRLWSYVLIFVQYYKYILGCESEVGPTPTPRP